MTLAIRYFATSSPTKFALANPRVQPESPKQNDTVTYSMDVTNTGRRTLSTTIKLTGDVTASKSISLGPKQSMIVSFTFTASRTGIYRLLTNGLEVSVSVDSAREPIVLTWE
jgi:hypothetical protein